MSNDVNTPEQEVNNAPEETVNDEQAPDETIGSYQEEEQTKDVPDSVPKARLDKEINRRKELEAKLAALEKEKDADPEVDDTKSDPEVKELAAKLAKIEENEKRAKRDAALAQGLEKALENAPEFQDVVNKDFILQLALNPANKDKTFANLLEEAYGTAINGKRTIETTTPRGGAKDTKVDVERAQRDHEYRRQVFSDPDLRKQYNEGLTDRLSKVL